MMFAAQQSLGQNRPQLVGSGLGFTGINLTIDKGMSETLDAYVRNAHTPLAVLNVRPDSLTLTLPDWTFRKPLLVGGLGAVAGAGLGVLICRLLQRKK